MRGAKRSHKDMVAIIQGGYFVVTGLWPIFHMRSFEAISGRKKEKWLVKAMGAMIACVGGAVLRDGLERRADERTCRLAVSSSAALGAVDVIYVLKNRISPVYLLDAVVELKLIGLWGLARLSGRRATRAEAGSPRIV